MHFFTADEHYGHKNIIEYCKRPFKTADEMDEALINRHNEVVGPDDTVIHVGDFCMKKNRRLVESAYIKRLNGAHVFLRGSHDYWLNKDPAEIDTGPVREIWEGFVHARGEAFYVVACHYPMISWPRAYHGSWQLFGHVHGELDSRLLFGKQLDVGVDTNNFYPYFMDQLITAMKKRPDNHEGRNRHLKRL